MSEISSSQQNYKTILDIHNDIYPLMSNDTLYLAEYNYTLLPIINSFRIIFNNHSNMSKFFGVANYTPEEQQNMKQYTAEYTRLIQRFATKYNINIPLQDNSCTVCSNCGTEDFIYQSNMMVCVSCGNQTESDCNDSVNFKETNNKSNVQKYKYSRITHFTDTLNQYQCIQTKVISDRVYKSLEEWFERNRLDIKKSTRDLMRKALGETKNSKHYEDLNLIYNYYTGIKTPDINAIREDLIADFTAILDVYDTLEEQVDRVNFLNVQYVLFQLLKRHKIEQSINAEFEILKTKDRLKLHDKIYKLICAKLDWTFEPVV
jgi:hypothetical protein